MCLSIPTFGWVLFVSACWLCVCVSVSVRVWQP